MNYPKAEEDFHVDDIFARIEMDSYEFQRSQHSYERLKNGGYPNAEALEVRYREMMG